VEKLMLKLVSFGIS